MRKLNRLTALKVNKASTPGVYSDGGGLYLQISEGCTKSWLFRFMRDGRARKMGLGSLHTISLADARERALAARKLLLDGNDPIEVRIAARQAQRLEVAKAVTFRHCAEQYIATHETGWRNPKHRDQWKATLEKLAYPIIGALPVGAVDTALVCKVLEPIWQTKTETASRLRGRIETVLDWAKARGYRTGENPARWRGHLQNIFPDKNKIARTKPREAMSFTAVPAFAAMLRDKTEISARALEFTILTAARTNETVGLRWSEIDWSAKAWLVPAERMKGGRPHRVALSQRAIDILSALDRDTEFVFESSRRAGQPLSNMAMLEMLRGMTAGNLTVHGFRSSFRDWGSETTNYPNEMLELALAHRISNKVEAAYRRGDMFEKRRRLMDDWAAYCAGGVVQNAVVVPIRAVS